MTVTINGTTGYSGPVGTIGDLTTTGNTTLGDASGDTLTLNGNTASIPNNLNFTGGNLGLGVTPSAWGSGYKALQVNGASLMASSSYAQLGVNNYWNGTNDIYIASLAASYYVQSAGAHKWFNAPSGTAGTAITFTQAMTLDASGQLVIGATSTSQKLRVYDSGSNTTIRAENGTSAFEFQSNVNDGYINMNGTGNIIFRTGSGFTERARIDSSGNMAIGATSAGGARLRLEDSSVNGVQSGIYNAYSGNSAYLNTYMCGPTGFSISGWDSSGVVEAVNQSAGSGTRGLVLSAYSGPLIFQVGLRTERARIDSSGNFVIGGTTASDKLTVKWATVSNSFGYFSNTQDGNTGIRVQNSGRDFGVFVNGGAGTNNYLRFYDFTAGTDRMIIGAAGGVSIGTSAIYGTGTPLTGQFTNIGAVSTNPSAIVWGVYGSGGGMPHFCGNWASANSWGIGPHSSSNDNIVRIGQINVSSSGAAWNGTYSNVYAGAYTNASDYRIKKNVADLGDTLAKVLELRPITYCAIHVPDEDGDIIPDRTEVGFIAHEVQALFPELVSGDKDEVDPSGRPQHQGLEYAKMTAILVKAIQELKAEFDAYKSTHP